MSHDHQCPVRADELVDLVYGALEPERAREVLQHTESCSSCRGKVDTVVMLTVNREAAIEALRAAEGLEPAAPVSIRWGCIAVIAGYLVVLAVAAYYAIQWLM